MSEMIGILFHGPEVFDTGWARRIIDAVGEVDTVRCVLAGTMGRTAVLDSGIGGIEFPGKMPGACLQNLEGAVSSIVLANYGKSTRSGMVMGGMVAKSACVTVPIVQAECSGPFLVIWAEGCDPALIQALEEIGLRRRPAMDVGPSIWETEGRAYRRMNTAAPGDFILMDGIMVGKAVREEVVIVCEGRRIVELRGAEIKEHGIEKLDRLGGVDLRTVKLASTSAIRRTERNPRVSKTAGCGVAFIDHAGMHVYDLVHDVEGAVVVGDDTTAVVGDILYRFQIPIIGIVDGDKDEVLSRALASPCSVILTVREDDLFGLRVFSDVFGNRPKIKENFEKVKERVIALAKDDLLEQRDV